jgi:hypothetical protein
MYQASTKSDLVGRFMFAYQLTKMALQYFTNLKYTPTLLFFFSFPKKATVIVFLEFIKE